MSFWGTLLGKSGGDLVKSVGGVLDEFIDTKEEKFERELELQKAEMAHELETRRLGIEEDSIHLEDAQSARDANARVQETANAGFLAKNVGSILALGTTLLTFVLFFVLMTDFVDFSKGDGKKEIALYVLGVLSAVTTQIFSFYFGSSSGSKRKTEMFEKMRDTK